MDRLFILKTRPCLFFSFSNSHTFTCVCVYEINPPSLKLYSLFEKKWDDQMRWSWKMISIIWESWRDDMRNEWVTLPMTLFIQIRKKVVVLWEINKLAYFWRQSIMALFSLNTIQWLILILLGVSQFWIFFILDSLNQQINHQISFTTNSRWPDDHRLQKRSLKLSEKSIESSEKVRHLNKYIVLETVEQKRFPIWN